DFGAWQAKLLSDDAGIAGPQREYWTRQLEGVPDEAGLPLDFARPRLPSGKGDAVEFSIDGQTRDKLAALCRELGITEFMLLQAAVAVVLHKAGAGTDIPLGTPVAGRSEAELEQLVGFFVNFVVLRNDLSGNPTLRDVLARTRDMALSAYSNQDLPFEQVVEAVNPPRTLARNPLFQVVVHVREQLPQRQMIDADTEFTALEPTFDIAQADLSLNFLAGDGSGEGQCGYTGFLIYRPDLYTRRSIERLAGWLHRVVSAFADTPDHALRDVEISSPDEKRRIVGEWSRGAQVHVLDSDLTPVAVGVYGDLHLGGGPFPGSEFYCTGDRARWGDDGRLEIVPGDRATAAPSAEPVVEWEAPQTDTERALATLLEDLLEAEDVGRHDDFFELGGDSVLAVQLAARGRDAGLDVTPRLVFEHPELAELATALDAGEGISDGQDDIHHAPMSASGLSEDELSALTESWSTRG
ncbi:non-ribosomal peptide synthetase, partial [Mycobacterium sp. ITM-2017-0098]